MAFRFTKVRDVKSPVRGSEKSAGIDFYVPTFTAEFFEDLIKANIGNLKAQQIRIYKEEIILAPGASIVIPSGIHVDFSSHGHEGMALVAFNKSSIGSQKGLCKLAEVVDEDYQGEVSINVTNTSNCLQLITQGEKLIQFLTLSVSYPDIQELGSLEELYPQKTERGENGFGKHTGNE